MPISKDEFESGRLLTELEKSLISFLERNRNKAFTIGEIMDGMNIETNFSDFWKAIISVRAHTIAIIAKMKSGLCIISSRRLRISVNCILNAPLMRRVTPV